MADSDHIRKASTHELPSPPSHCCPHTSTLSIYTCDAGWVEAFDPGSGRPYYVHLASSTTTWERPTGGPAGAAAAGGAAAGGSGGAGAAAAAGAKKVYSAEILALWRKLGDFVRVEATSKITSKNKKFAGLRKVRRPLAFVACEARSLLRCTSRARILPEARNHFASYNRSFMLSHLLRSLILLSLSLSLSPSFPPQFAELSAKRKREAARKKAEEEAEEAAALRAAQEALTKPRKALVNYLDVDVPAAEKKDIEEFAEESFEVRLSCHGSAGSASCISITNTRAFSS